ncbi:WD repeat-containing protein 63 [Contarinia nasturtii]|uniref:WD repeat-containing protein 63 n=1 Tax=Contarinia nasturtii TaxID=265458 RepID=UPI0012D41417|nr:WD repeat-containing protein 63 [Contarinia nasturtii]
MEFVLVTTNISTPESSRSGSVMKFGDYREDDQKLDEAVSLPLEKEFLGIASDSDDEDQALLDGFNALSARHRLLSHEFCTKVILDQDQQRALQLVIGLHVSEENPWKQIRKETLLCYLPDDENAKPEQVELRLKLLELADDAFLLAGFAAAITDIDNTDTFLFYADPESAKESVSLIQRLEAFERQRINKTIFKYPRPWKNLGSDAEVDLQVETKSRDKLEVEVQRLCANNKTPYKLSFRFADDVRDGYVELVPKHKNFDVITRSRVSIGIQSAAQLVESEQQTDPTFPANAWSQYSYELPIDPNQPEESVEGNDETEVEASSVDQDEEEKSKDFIGPSDAMKELIRVLEFNAIDMYRDDYEQIASKSITQYIEPVITEVFCFIDPKRCTDRVVSAFAWHPNLSGIFVASYTYKALNTFAKDEKISDDEMNKRSVMLSNPVLMWSFDDTLYPKLILESSREVTFLSFCPYDANILIGGLINGQLIIWDLNNCLNRVENPTELTEKQERNRKKMHSFMKWSKFAENLQQNIVRASAISHVQLSHKKPITSIKWLNRKHCVASSGLIGETIKPNEFYRQFVSASLDGTVLFWDLDFMNTDIAPSELKRTDTKKQLPQRVIAAEYVSPYEKLNGVFQPIYAAACEQPISSLIFDEGLFRYEPKSAVENVQIEQRTEFDVIHEQQEKASNRLVISSLLGSIATFIWEGFLYKEGKPEKAKQIESYATIHNGPVLSIERNPFMSSINLSVGKDLFAVWSELNQSAPVLWRRRETNITCAQWSPTRISLFFVARYGGIIELWDLLTRTDEACITHDAGTNIITVISQHRLSLPTDVLMIADEKANLRAFTLPTISQPIEDDHDKFKEFINMELRRKEEFNKWQESLTEKNGDFLEETKQLLREESRRTLQSPMPPQSEKESKVKDEKRHSSVGVRSKSVTQNAKSKHVFDYSERLHKKWEEMMVKKMMKTMLRLKRFDPEQIAMKIKPERDRQAYNVEKKRAIDENFKKIHQEICEIRARLIPPKDVDQEAERLNFITSNVENILMSIGDRFQYTELQKKLEISKTNMIEIKWNELIDQAQITRSKRSKSIFEERRRAYLEKAASIEAQIEENK